MRKEVRHHRELAELGARQHGVVSHAQMRGLGYSDAAIARATVAGRLHCVHRGVFLIGHPRLTDHGRCYAAVVACGEDPLLSHESAAWLWGLLRPCPPRPHVTLPSRGHMRGRIEIHHSTILETADRAVRERLPVTAVPRTLLDLAASSGRVLGDALQSAERLGLLGLPEIDELLARSGGHVGRRRLRSALGLYRDPAFTRSELERRFLKLVRDAGLPRPLVNYFVAGYELDMYWPEERFAVELDGYATHGTRVAFERDRVRQEDLKLAGIEIVRLTARRIANEPDEALGRLRLLLERRRRELQ